MVEVSSVPRGFVSTGDTVTVTAHIPVVICEECTVMNCAQHGAVLTRDTHFINVQPDFLTTAGTVVTNECRSITRVTGVPPAQSGEARAAAHAASKAGESPVGGNRAS